MNVYRMTTRFDLDNEEERRAVEYLKGLKRGTANRFVVEAVLSHIEQDRDNQLLHIIRQIFREEMTSATSCIASANSVQESDMNEAAQAENDLSVLDDLDTLFG